MNVTYLTRLVNRLNVHDVVVFLFVLFLPTQFGTYFFMPFSYVSGVRVDYLAPAIFATDILIIVLAVLYWNTLKKILITKTHLLIFLLFFAHCILAYHPLLAIYKLIKYTEIYIVFLLFSTLANVSRKIYIPLFLGATIEFFVSLFHLANGHSLQGLFYFLGERYFTLSTPGIAKAALFGVEFLRPYGTFSHPNSMGGFYLLVFFLSLFIFEKEKLPKRIAILFISIALVVMSFSKIATGTLFFLYTGFLIYRLTSTCRLCSISRIISLAVIFFLVTLTQTDPQSLYKRIELFKHAVFIVQQHLLFGVGLGHYLLYEARIPFVYSFFSLQPVHNIFVLFLAETGLIIFIVFGFLGVRFLAAYKKNIAFLFCFAAFVLTGMFDHYWLTLQQNMLLLGVVFGLLAGKNNAPKA